MKPPQTIWETKLDKRWRIKVIRIDDNFGELRIWDRGGKKPVFVERVPLLYGAQFGPDIDDVRQWQNISVRFADSQPANRA